jgi:hypothetical protein
MKLLAGATFANKRPSNARSNGTAPGETPGIEAIDAGEAIGAMVDGMGMGMGNDAIGPGVVTVPIAAAAMLARAVVAAAGIFGTPARFAATMPGSATFAAACSGVAGKSNFHPLEDGAPSPARAYTGSELITMVQARTALSNWRKMLRVLEMLKSEGREGFADCLATVPVSF